MPELLLRLVRFYETPHGRKLFRYSMVSVVSTAVSFAVLGITYGALRLWSEVPDTLLANLVATIPSYYLNRNWAWGKSGRSHLTREVLPFWGMAVAGILFSIFTSSEAKHLSDVHHLHHFGRTVLVLGANLGAFGILWVLKFLVFNRLFHVHLVDDADEMVEAQLAD
jgi:putative flippase GtrA